MPLISNSMWHVEITIWDLCYSKWILLAKWLLLLLLFLFKLMAVRTCMVAVRPVTGAHTVFPLDRAGPGEGFGVQKEDLKTVFS